MSEKHVAETPLRADRTYTRANNKLFYAAVPEPYKEYYLHFVQHWLEWYDGEVSYFHGHSGYNHGIFSTRLAYSIAMKLAKQIVGGRAMFDQRDDETEEVNGLRAKELMEKWSARSDFSNKLRKSVEWAIAAGDSILKLDVFKRGELTVNTLRKDNFFLDTDVNGNITAISTHLHTMTKQVPKQQGEKAERHYFLLEERRYNDNGKPQYRISIKEGDQHSVNYRKGDFHSADFNFNELTKTYRDEIKKLYPDIMFNEWYDLPLKDLGVYQIKYTDGVSFRHSLPYGESAFSSAIHILMSYDFYYSSKMTDVALGRGRTLIPRAMSNPVQGEGYYNVLSQLFYEKVPYTNPDQQKPESIQFDLRSSSWTEIRNDLLQELSTALNLSPRTVASYAVPASEKPTAHEISVDQDDTALTVEQKRELNEPAINNLIEAVLEYYGFNDSTVRIKFSKMGQVHMNTMTNQVSILKQNGLIDTRTAVEMVFPDKTESEINDIVNRIKEEQTTKTQQQSFNQQDNDVMEQNEQMYNTRTEHVPKENEE